MSIAAIILAVIYSIENREGSYSLEKKWSIQLSDNCKEIYSSGSDVTFNGDGEFYHVLECDDIKNVSKQIVWVKEKNTDIESMAKSKLEGLSVKNKYVLKFDSDYEFYHKQDHDGSSLILIHFLDNNYIYVIENIM